MATERMIALWDTGGWRISPDRRAIWKRRSGRLGL